MHDDLVIRLEEGREDEPIVYCERDGSWWAGRYVGSVTFEGRRLDIRPRFGERILRSWLAGAFNLAVVDTEGQLAESDWFVPWLLASVWSRAFVSAARHGVPALRTDVRESGLSVKGRVDVTNTVRLRAAGTPGVASLRREKTLDNPISSAVVAAHVELTRWIGKHRADEWLPERVKQLLPHLVAAVGMRPRVPTQAELNNVRLTPITAGFRPLAELSVRIAGRRGLANNASDEGTCKGVLLDVAELWELYVLAVLRRAWPGLDVSHGTRDSSSHALLRNESGKLMGMLKPDAVVSCSGVNCAIIDAKYKRLMPTTWNQAPQREDMYQLAAYLGRFGLPGEDILGLLAYPSDPATTSTPPAEAGNPWRLDSAKMVHFITIPHDLESAAEMVRSKVPIPSLRPSPTA
jgi:5-methylcytosine-specific restriction enzyme subunit McrC